MIKVLWIACNPLQVIRNNITEQASDGTGGWLDGGAEAVIKEQGIELSYCFQYPKELEGKVDGIKYYTMPMVRQIHFKDISGYGQSDLERFRYILQCCTPDVIQIFGTESLFQRQFVEMAYDLKLIDKTIVWVQGLVSFCSKCYTDGLNINQIRTRTPWEILRGTNVEGIQRRLALNGRGEIRVLKILKNVFVRTEWDAACCRAINPELNLYYCNETLRNNFYENNLWELEKAETHSIFMSQYRTPIKGFHKMLEALPIILREFPDSILYTTGPDILKKGGNLLDRIRETSYEKILRNKIIENHLENHIHFMGTLQGKQMRDRYIKSHVFVSASSIENSPNSVGEAMILGVPIVASDVGGVASMMTHKVEGFLYPFNESAMLAEYICKIFRDNQLAKQFSYKARIRGKETHDCSANYNILLECYKQMIEVQR